MVQMKRFINTFAVFFILQYGLYAQVSDTFVHTIQPGETIYSIARTYKVSPQEILTINPSAADGIKSGEKLFIPQSADKVDEQGYHTISQGETLYQLSQKYNVSATAICKANPGLSINNFKVGMVIKIPKKDLQYAEKRQEKIKEDIMPRRGIANSGCMEMYKVGRKETLFSIAQQFGVTEEEIKAANVEMYDKNYKLRKGTFICIPYPKQKKTIQKPAQIIPTNQELFVTQPKAEAQKHISLAVILPFDGAKKEKTKMVEFYRGILMAADSIKKEGISLDIYTYDSGKTDEDMRAVIKSLPQTPLDFIIGPLHQEQIHVLSSYCNDKKIRLIVPFSSQSEELYQNPYYYAVNSPSSFFISEAVNLTMALFHHDNIIIWDSHEEDEDAVLYTDSIQLRQTKMGKKNKTVSIGDDNSKWAQVMDSTQVNVIIPNSSSLKALNQLLPELKLFIGEHPEYKVKLIGYPEWQTYTINHLEDFYQFDTYAYSAFYRNPLSTKSQLFEMSYQNEFKELTLNSYPQFGMFGFDIAYYFLKGISTYGKGLELHHTSSISQPFQHWFNFKRISNWSGFINKGIQFIHYNPEFNIELIRLR